ncbi:MAG TPA: bifunctional hydroxymethylpyrimidine kinase/phosphomethylpyrimidine kinase [Tepidisphaeraceae bacterium]|nr:bifunctional hydroxymethylpyrimidine kinase/phosphomethylpyrimidine kinase [Tepidisphaeraceae bacterium]
MKTALTIGGSDSSGGAGIQADLKTFSVLGVFGMSAITVVTAQNTLGIKELVELAPDIVRKQIDTTASDIQVDATKTGMLSNIGIIEAVEAAIKLNNLAPYVCDAVLNSSGARATESSDARNGIIKRLFPLATVVTAGLTDAAALAGVAESSLSTVAAAKDAAKRIAGMGARAVVVTGIVSAEQVIDVFFDGVEMYELAGKLQPKEKTHGSGSAFSAAITAGLANRMSLLDATDQAKQLVNMAIQYGDGQGRGTTPVNVLAFAPKKK